MTTVTPYLNFEGNCKEAMTFYQQCLGGSLSLMTVGETSMADQLPPAMKDKIMHAALMSEGATLLMASDIGQPITTSNQIVLSINCTSESEINTLFSNLSQGGNVTHPLGVEFWGALFGQLVDQFGVRWMLNHDKK